MKEKSILNKVRTLLGMEVKLEMMKLIDGTTVLEAEMFEADNEVFIITEDEQRIPLPIGEYELENAMILVVVEEGIISEVKEAKTEEEVAEPEAEAEVEVEAEKSVNPIAKKVIESVSKETFFSAEIEELKKEIEELKTQLSAQTNEVATEEVAPVELAEEVKPISFNPENEKPIEGFKIASKAGRSTMDNILSKINNI
tara:strand:+ start:91 stop:687 length:597 start_codon:yes stop_codon:yes gene_type:complete